MKAFRLLAAVAALVLAAGEARAQQLPTVGGVQLSGGGLRSPPPPPQSIVHRVPGGFGGFFPYYIEREYVPVIEREIIREVPVEAPPPPPPPRKPYALGRSYSSLPGGCMKMIEGGASYYLCNGDWYRQVADGQYKAVARP